RVLLGLAQRIENALQATGRGLVSVGNGAVIGIGLGGLPILNVIGQGCRIAFRVRQGSEISRRIVAKFRRLAQWVDDTDQASVGVILISPEPPFTVMIGNQVQPLVCVTLRCSVWMYPYGEDRG